MATKKIRDRVEKLMRLAAPMSGATEPERISAALEAAKLFAQHQLSVHEPAPPPMRRAPAPQYSPFYSGVQYEENVDDAPPPPPPDPRQQWEAGQAQRATRCADDTCTEVIQAGEPVWIRQFGYGPIEYVHRNGPCGW